MRKIYLFFFLISIIFSNINTNNIQGIGENRILQDPSMIALGNSWYFSGQTNGLAIKNIASHWRSSLAQISSSFSFINNTFDEYPKRGNQSLNYIHFQFPVGKNKSLGFSLTPSTRTNYHIIDEGLDSENILFNGEIINTDMIYFGKGGITDLMLSYSMLIENNISIGLSWNIGLGNLIMIDTLLTNNIIPSDYNEFIYNNLYTDTYESRYLFKSNSFNLNGLFTKNNIEIASSIILDYNLFIENSQNYFTNNNFYSGTEYLSNSFKSTNSGVNIREFGLGAAYKINKTIGLNFEIHQNNQRLVPYSFNIFNNNKEKVTSLHIGCFKWIPSTNYRILNTLILRSGAYFEKSTNLYDTGLTFGLGIEYLNNTSFVNLGYKFGFRNSTLIELRNERYSEFIISFISSDKWFK